ncbi:MAG: AmpG family muropeptide MFS transporter, partial [Deltaproteobacteria bacterium]|nr:AmpG family muropeptide MFS transporter [Deltaproteobacteria bacterium]
GTVANLFGFWATIGGGLAGGLLMLRLGIHQSLWIFGLLQALSTGCFALLASIGANVSALAGIIAFENVSSGMGTAAYAAFLASITHKRYTATQYALLSSLMGIPRVVMSSLTGYMATQVGWVPFFLFCMGIAIPGLILLKTLNASQVTVNGVDANAV